MGITETFIFILLLVVAIIGVSFVEFKRKYKKELKKIKHDHREFLMTKPPMDYLELKELLDTVLAETIIDIQLRFEVNEVKYIKNVEKETVDATQEVLSLVAPNIIEQMKCYVDERYIVQYVARNVRGFFISYLKDKNIGG